MATNTTNYSWIKPSVNDPTDQDLWGGYLNSNLDSQDTTLKTVSDKANLSSPVINAQTVDYTTLAADQNKLVTMDATGGNRTFTLQAAATAGSGFILNFKKIDSSTNTVTIDPNGAETIDGQSTFVLSSQYESVTIISNGTNWLIRNKNLNQTSGLVLLATRTASASASLDFTSLITTTYDNYVFEIQDIVPATDSVSFGLRTSTNNGSSWDSGGSDYAIAGTSSSGSSLNNGASVTGTISDPSTGLSTNATRSLVGRVVFQNPLNSTRWRMIKFSTAFLGTTGALINCEGVVSRVTAADVDAVQFLMSSGNIASGVIRLYGVSK